MTTKLEILLKEIDPSKTIQPISKNLDRSINTFKLEKAAVNTIDEFETCLANFICHSDKFCLSRTIPVKKGFDYHRSLYYLKEEYGPEGGRIAYEMAKTGINGGLYAVIKTIARRMANEYIKNRIGCTVHDFWKNLTSDERVAAAEEYRKKYGHLLPAKFKEWCKKLLAIHLTEILEEHPAMIQRMRQAGR